MTGFLSGPEVSAVRNNFLVGHTHTHTHANTNTHTNTNTSTQTKAGEGMNKRDFCYSIMYQIHICY